MKSVAVTRRLADGYCCYYYLLADKNAWARKGGARFPSRRCTPRRRVLGMLEARQLARGEIRIFFILLHLVQRSPRGDLHSC